MTKYLLHDEAPVSQAIMCKFKGRAWEQYVYQKASTCLKILGSHSDNLPIQERWPDDLLQWTLAI
ncbi:hypothetical protein F2Q69_00054299 [Brassica cretica]|uniref:Uncharacterized protein n=1 Tax=Brassica cretica TaxID=69181 RepID=A0A8S9N5A4_BRACR|nr:hypothetical protein F2Q69_00054299 [Brassica cretica]